MPGSPSLSPGSCCSALTRPYITSLHQITAISLESRPRCGSAARGPRVTAGTQATPRLPSGCNYRHAAGISVELLGAVPLCTRIIARAEITRPEMARGAGMPRRTALTCASRRGGGGGRGRGRRWVWEGAPRSGGFRIIPETYGKLVPRHRDTGSRQTSAARQRSFPLVLSPESKGRHVPPAPWVHRAGQCREEGRHRAPRVRIQTCARR